jgi:hypothetical protein
MRRIAICLFVAAMSMGTSPIIPSDWKYVGDSVVGGGGGPPRILTHDFYLSSELKRLPNKHVQVWTKSIAVTDMDKAQLDEAAIQRAARKVTTGYMPPFVSMMSIPKQRVDVIAFEEQADEAAIQPRMRALWEVDCEAQMVRSLSIVVTDRGKFGTSDKPDDWQHVVPETSGQWLMQLVCK